MKAFLTKSIAFLLVFGLVCELFFRVVLPARESPLVRQDPVTGLRQFDPDGPRDGLFTSGRLAHQQSRWHINAQGWNSDVDYVPDTARDTPAIVITGDSQIEGMYVDPRDHLIQRVEALSDHRVAGYSMAGSGYKLGEYVRLAAYLDRMGIRPSVLVLYINPGDFWRGIKNLAGRTGLAPRIAINADGSGHLVPGGVHPVSRIRRLFRHSAVVRYVVFNARLNPFAQGPADLAMNQSAVDPEHDAAENPIYAHAFSFMVKSIGEVLPDTKLLFVVDADRHTIMAGGHPTPIPTSAVVKAGCARLGCRHLDLTAPFIAAWRKDAKPLHFDHNPHWTAYTHAVAAQAVFDTLENTGWMPSSGHSRR